MCSIHLYKKRLSDFCVGGGGGVQEQCGYFWPISGLELKCPSFPVPVTARFSPNLCNPIKIIVGLSKLFPVFLLCTENVMEVGIVVVV